MIDRDLEIAIVGGGIGGLSVARGLVSAGFKPTVYERAPTLEPVGAGITVSMNAMAALDQLGLADAVRSAGIRCHRFRIIGADGRPNRVTNLEPFEERTGYAMTGILRSALHRVLLDSLEDRVPVRLGRACVACVSESDRATLRFDDGTTVEADLVIGADGIRSVLRDFAAPAQALRYSGQTGWRGLAPVPAAGLPLFDEIWGHGLRFGAIQVSTDQVYWYAAINAPAETVQTDGAEVRAWLAQQIPETMVDARALVAATPPEAILRTDIWDAPPARDWFRERVVLLGDAIHPTTPNLGQGAAMALESAVELVRCFSASTDLGAALRLYAARRQARTAWVTRTSLLYGSLAQLRSHTLGWLRDRLMRLSGVWPLNYLERHQMRRLLEYRHR